MKEYDVIVVGGGPGGYTAACALARAGKRVCLFEADRLGGTCLNVGCIPTKYLLDKAAALDRIRVLTGEGILRGAGEYSMRAIVRGRDAVTDRLRGGVEGMLRSAGVEVISRRAELHEGLRVSDGEGEYRASDIIIATGSSPFCPPFPGAELCHDSTSALTPNALTSDGRLPRRLAVIGGGVIGLELGSAYLSFGSQVTVIEALPDILTGELPEAASRVRRGLEARGMKFVCSSRVERVEKTQDACAPLRVCTSAGVLEADAVLTAVGRRPRLSGIDADKLGLALNRGGIAVDAHMRTSLRHVYAIGDVTGGMMLAHAAYAEAEAAVRAILEGDSAAPVDISVLPRCVYSSPALAAVGLSPAQAAERGIEVSVGRADYAANGMALAEGESGCAFAVTDKKSTRLIGFWAVGAGAYEIIAAATLAVKQGMTVKDWKNTIVAHPTLSETLKEAVLAAGGA